MTTATILVDADACPVKDEIYRVAWRHEVAVKVPKGARVTVFEERWRAMGRDIHYLRYVRR